MRPPLSARAANALAKAALLLACLTLSDGEVALAMRISDGTGADAGSYLPVSTPPAEDLYLDVYINGVRLGLLSAFHRYADGCLTIDKADLLQLNLKVPDSAAHKSGGICLEHMPGVSYRYDAKSQSIYLSVTDDARVPLIFDAHPSKRDLANSPSESNLSAIFNYTLFANFNSDDFKTAPSYEGASAYLDGHLFSQYGGLDQSFTVRSAVPGMEPNLLRLDSRWYYDQPDKLISYAAGDVISGSLPWTRALRLGGIQVRRDFALQPDLVTQPIPQFSGSAAVPSTVEIYANQSRAFSQQVAGGPFSITNIPVVSGPGTMRLVIRDASGKETITEYAYYNSPLLIAPGLFDYSAESGFARTYYGLASNSYNENPIGSASFRYGLTPRLTVEGHAEGGAGLFNGGLGIAFGLSHYGVASLALSGSDKSGEFGAQGAGSFETSLWGARLFARSLRTLADYRDLVSATAPKTNPNNASSPITAAQSGAPYRRQDQVSLSLPFGFDPSFITFSYTDAEDAANARYKIGTASYSRPFFWDRSTLSVTAFNDFERKDSYGVFASLTFSWDKYTASAIADAGAKSYSAGGVFSRSLGEEPGSFGYTVRAQEGSASANSASVSYRTTPVLLQAGIQQTGKNVQMTAQADGSVAILNGIYFANRIDNSFAVVDTGIAGAKVLRENRPVGETDSNGRLLIPYMLAREQNSIAIDAASLPVQADMPETKQVVVPAERGGVTVRFKGNPAPASALVSFRDEKGTFLPAGSEVWVNGDAAPLAIGYDGEAYLTGLSPSNSARIKKPNGAPCEARFDFVPSDESQVRISDVLCKAEGAAGAALRAGPAETIRMKR